MSCCHSNYPSCGCSAFVEVSCGDPGLETSGRHLAIYDSQFCARRLANVNGFLTYASNGLSFSNDPTVLMEDLEVVEGQLFGALLINTDGGKFRRVVPASGVDGNLRADGNGNYYIQDPADAVVTIPDPLVVTDLVATNANLANVVISGTPGFTGLITDTIVSPVGLNGANQLVKGSVATIAMAQFYESPSLGSPATPNFTYPTSATANVQIGNEISDVSNIAHVVSQEIVEIDVSGLYAVRWYGQYIGYNINGSTSAGTAYNPGLWITVNGVLRSLGNVQTYQDRNIGGTAVGEIVSFLAAGDQIRLQGNGSMRSYVETGGTGLRGVTLVLTKYN